MKSSVTHFVLGSVLLLASHSVLAACNTVTSECVGEKTVNVAPHMKSENTKQTKNVVNKITLAKPSNKPNNNTIASDQAKETSKKYNNVHEFQ